MENNAFKLFIAFYTVQSLLPSTLLVMIQYYQLICRLN